MVLTGPPFAQCKNGRYGYDWAFAFLDNPQGPTGHLTWMQVLEWCVHTYGSSMDVDPHARWGNTFEYMVFEDKQDAMLFKLQWC